MENHLNRSPQLYISQKANRITFNQDCIVRIKYRKKVDTLAKESTTSSTVNSDGFHRENPGSQSFSLKKIQKNEPLRLIREEQLLELKKNLSQKIEPLTKTEKKSLNISKQDPDLSHEIEKNSEILVQKKEIERLISECSKYEDTIKIYEKRYNSIKLKASELESENEFLKKRLKQNMKKIKEIESKNRLEDSKGVIKRLSGTTSKAPNEYQRKSSTNKYLIGVLKKHPSDSKEFMEEIENFLEYKEFMLNKTVEHYKKTIENLKLQIKSKNSEIVPTVDMNALSLFFSDCVKTVKNEIANSRQSIKILKTDKIRILEMFLLNENVLKIIYSNLMECSKDLVSHKIKESIFECSEGDSYY